MRSVLFSAILSCCLLAGCKNERREPPGKRISVDAPFTDVDVFVPDDDEEHTEVDVEVDH